MRAGAALPALLAPLLLALLACPRVRSDGEADGAPQAALAAADGLVGEGRWPAALGLAW